MADETWMDDFDLEESLTKLRDVSVEMAVYLEVVNTLKKRCHAYIKETGEVAQVEGVILKFSKGYTSTRVDQKAVKEDARNDESLQKYVYQKDVAPGLSIIIE